jgi:hypothetical protein
MHNHGSSPCSATSETAGQGSIIVYGDDDSSLAGVIL